MGHLNARRRLLPLLGATISLPLILGAVGARRMELSDHKWILVVDEGKAASQGADIWVRFAVGKGTFEGFAGCNRFGGRFELKGSGLKIESPEAST